MNITAISFKNLLNKPLTSLLSLLLLALGVAMIAFMMVVNTNLENDFRKNIKDIDLVVGAKGSPLQLILSAVYQIDNPTGNINYRDVTKTLKNPLVAETIPLAYGDSYNGFRIVGTEHAYTAHYGLELEDGRLWEAPFECTIGIRVAREQGLAIGDTFFSQHGLVDDTHVHDNMAFKVVGIFVESGTVVDRLILTPIESIWLVHDDHGDHDHAHEGEHDHEGHDHDHGHEHEGEHSHDGHDHEHDHGEHEHDDHDHGHDHDHAEDAEQSPAAAKGPEAIDPDREITAVLVKFRSSMGMMALPNKINKDTNFQSALPAIEINRLFELFGAGISALRMIAVAIIIISAMSMFISLYNSLKERKYELALMRSMGAAPGKLFLMILAEANLLGVAGIALGYGLSRVGLALATQFAENQMSGELFTWVPLSGEWLLFLLVLVVANVAALIPAYQSTRLNISAVLTKK